MKLQIFLKLGILMLAFLLVISAMKSMNQRGRPTLIHEILGLRAQSQGPLKAGK